MFTFSFAVHTKGGVWLCPKAREGNIRLAEMAYAIGGMVDTVECTCDLLQSGVGALPHEIIERQVAFGCGDVENIRGKL